MTGKEDCEKVMNSVLPFAQQMLKRYGEFYPFGGFMKPNGEIVHVGAKDGKSEHPKSDNLIALLRQSLTQMAAKGLCKATAVLFDVRVTPPGSATKMDAIQMCLDHADGYSAEVFMPHKIEPDGQVKYSAMFAQQGNNEIFRRR
jgi:hypothetical protein